jgi:WD40 repeat protein
VWDLSSRKVIRSYEGHGGGVNTVLFHPDGTCIASGSTDGSLKVRAVCLSFHVLSWPVSMVSVELNTVLSAWFGSF